MDHRQDKFKRCGRPVSRPREEEIYEDMNPMETEERYAHISASAEAGPGEQPTEVDQEEEWEVETSGKKQPKNKLIKCIKTVVWIFAILVALVLFTTFTLAVVHIHLLKETQGISFGKTVEIILHIDVL